MKAGFLNNLQLKVTVVFLLVSLVPLGTVSIFSVRTADNVIESIVQNQLENVAAEKQALLERWITERKADMEVLAGSAAVKQVDPAEVAPYFELVREQYGVYRRFLITDPDGKVVYDSGGASGDSCAGEVWYQRAISGRPYMSEIELAATEQESVFRLATPIRGPDGRVQGVLCAVASTQAIVASVLRVELGRSGECYLVDGTGTFLAHQDSGRILNENIAMSGSFQHIFDGARGQPIYTDYRGIQVLGASRSLKGIDWHVVVEQDRDEAFGPSDQLQRNIWIVIAVTVVGAIGFSTLLAWYVASPIRRLSEAARTLARGDFDNALLDARTTRRDEIGALYAAFEDMAGQLKDRHSSLETRMGLTEAELQRVEAELKGTLEAAARSERLAALGRLASGVAHEIRTPLTSLKLFLQSVQEDITVSLEQSEDYRIAMRQVARIEKTINHFLDFARPQQPVLAELDFVQLVDEVLEVIRPRANQQEVEIHECIATELPKVEGDVRQMGEVLVNLLVNALDAMPDGGRLTISIAAEAAQPGWIPPTWVRIDVSDTGPGIPEEDLDRLFEPFFTTKAAGSGLGLAIIKGTLERHSGTVSVNTRLGAGTTFSVRLPVAPA
ncbi:MAG TPA: cache domain-containing protein [Thermoguttaceae bacterium]|nr:cache domain-containing protein [Thermoguttaceae bacterium]